MIEFLSWDTDFFGYKVGKVTNLETDIFLVLSEAKKQNYKLLYASLNPNNILQNKIYIENNGFLADQKITFLQNIPNDIKISENKTELYENTEINQNLISLALQSGIYSRFKIDKNFKNQEFERLYTTWIENSVKKEIAQKVIIQKENNQIIALLTLGIKNKRADIGILAVDTHCRGKKVGKNLIERAFFESNLLNQNLIQVVTQKANQEACCFYQKMGFQIEKIENIYHFWI
jgi:dTDP-4-amino-4,6-dideoxy-D-galactose acyltransferase